VSGQRNAKKEGCATAIFTAEQQAYLDGVHNTLLDAVDILD
jgi:hypothetical protein